MSVCFEGRAARCNPAVTNQDLNAATWTTGETDGADYDVLDCIKKAGTVDD